MQHAHCITIAIRVCSRLHMYMAEKGELDIAHILTCCRCLVIVLTCTGKV
jgi:hypothetical protein